MIQKYRLLIKSILKSGLVFMGTNLGVIRRDYGRLGILKSSPKFLWLMLCIFLFSTSIAYADNEWTKKELDGRDVYSLAIDPLTPTTIYAGTWDGVFKRVFEQE